MLNNNIKFIEYINGDKEWYLNNKIHREDGPAIEFANGDKYWYKNGLKHREDGCAVEYANGIKQWWLNGEYVNVKSKEEFKRYLNLMIFR